MKTGAFLGALQSCVNQMRMKPVEQRLRFMIATFQAFSEGRRYFWLASIMPYCTESQKEGSVLIIGVRESVLMALEKQGSRRAFAFMLGLGCVVFGV